MPGSFIPGLMFALLWAVGAKKWFSLRKDKSKKDSFVNNVNWFFCSNLVRG